MKYQWTDWITHVPGQELLPGTYALCEFVGARRRGGKPFLDEGMIRTEMKGHPCWRMTDPHGVAVQLLRYKLRSIAEENEVVSERELDLVE